MSQLTYGEQFSISVIVNDRGRQTSLFTTELLTSLKIRQSPYQDPLVVSIDYQKMNCLEKCWALREVFPRLFIDL